MLTEKLKKYLNMETTNSFTVLFDYDSLVYMSVYKICSISDIRGWFEKGKTKSWMEQEILNLALNRLSQMDTQIFEEIESTGIKIDDVKYFLTACKKSIRKKESPGLIIKNVPQHRL